MPSLKSFSKNKPENAIRITVGAITIYATSIII